MTYDAVKTCKVGKDVWEIPGSQDSWHGDTLKNSEFLEDPEKMPNQNII